MSILVPILDPLLDLILDLVIPVPGHPDLVLVLVSLYLVLVNLDLRSEKLLMSPSEARSHATSQYQNPMVTIDWIASDGPLISYLHGNLQHAA